MNAFNMNQGRNQPKFSLQDTFKPLHQASMLPDYRPAEAPLKYLMIGRDMRPPVDWIFQN
jgi:hypothetical protein